MKNGIRPYSLLIIAAISVAGCATTRPNSSDVEAKAPYVVNHIVMSPVPSPTIFKVRSVGAAFGNMPPQAVDLKWQQVGKISSANFVVAIHAREHQAQLIQAFLRLPPDDSSAIAVTSKLSLLSASLGETDRFLSSVFGSYMQPAEINLYFGAHQDTFLTPVTEWQEGPTVAPVRLNIAMMLPPLKENFGRFDYYNDTKFATAVIVAISHEFTHVIDNNATGRLSSSLAGEFLAHSIEKCVGNLVYRFNEPSTNVLMRDVAKAFAEDPVKFIDDSPFTNSTPGNVLASAGYSFAFAQADSQNPSVASLQSATEQYCRNVFSARPSFSDAKGGIEWVFAHALGHR